MGKNSMNWLLLTVNLLVMVPSIGSANQFQCKQLFTSHRGLVEPKVDWKDDRSFIEASQRREVLGQVSTFFSEKWDTQIYHTNTGVPDSKGKTPLVDPDSKAVFIFFHGSGTMKSGGRNFIPNMNVLANLGYSAISVDMPFHGEGPTSPAFNNSNHFMEWMRSIVLEAKKSGKPVYLAGHSFGPDVILEFATRYPKTIDGVVALSPAAFNKELTKWYYTYTTKMKFGGDVEENEAGGIWAAKMSKQFHWSKYKLADPTVINPNLKIRILSGDREEYVEAPLGGPGNTPIGKNTYDISIPLRAMLKHATITIEPGIGHYLFEHQDKDGFNVVLRELLAIVDESPSRVKFLADQIRKENMLLHPSGVIAKKYNQDAIFKNWVDTVYGPAKAIQVANQKQDVLAQKMMDEYALAIKAREFEIYQRILNTKTTNPDFYLKYQTLFDKFNPQKVDITLFYPFLAMVLNSNTQNVVVP